MSDSNQPHANEQAHLDRARVITAAQIKMAEDLIRTSPMNGPEVYAAILTALATNYAATVAKNR